MQKILTFLSSSWKRVTLLLGIPSAVVAILTIWNNFEEKPPEELNSLPHIVYEWSSNYYDNYLGKKTYVDRTFADLKIINASQEVIRNLVVETFFFPQIVDTSSQYLNNYQIDVNNYLSIGNYAKSTFKPLDSVKINIAKMVYNINFFKNDTSLIKEILFPQQEYPLSFAIEKINTNANIGLVRNDLNISPEYNSRREFEIFKSIGNLTFNGFFGIPIKIVVKYEIKNIQVKQILIGGMVYLLQRNNNEYYPLPAVINSLYLAYNSFWCNLSDYHFHPIYLYQEIGNNYKALNDNLYVARVRHLGEEGYLEKRTFDICYNINLIVNPFQWSRSKTTDYYILQVAEDSLFTNIVNNINTVDTFWYPNNLKPLTEYFWRVKGVNSAGESKWSGAWSFTTGR